MSSDARPVFQAWAGRRFSEIPALGRQPAQQCIQVGELSRQQVAHIAVPALPDAFHRQQPAAQDGGAVFVVDLGPDDDLHLAGFVFQRDEQRALGGLRLLAAGDDAAGLGPAAAGQVLQLVAVRRPWRARRGAAAPAGGGAA
jgi:hypothetical protein